MKPRHSILGALSAIALTVAGIAPTSWASTQHSGTEHFLALQTALDVPGSQFIVANGPIHAAGVDVQINAQRDKFVFPKGTVSLWHQAKSGRDSFDPTTCLETVTERGVYKVTGGTGRYSHATGHGTYRVLGYLQGGCDGGPTHVFTLTIHIDGPLSY